MDYNEIAKYEKAIKDKYGNEAIQNPKKNWDEQKEAKYLEELKAFYKGSTRKKKREELPRLWFVLYEIKRRFIYE